MYLKGIGELSPSEQLVYNYWLITLSLLELGIPWDAIQKFTPAELAVILAVNSAKAERQAESEAQVQRAIQMRR